MSKRLPIFSFLKASVMYYFDIVPTKLIWKEEGRKTQKYLEVSYFTLEHSKQKFLPKTSGIREKNLNLNGSFDLCWIRSLKHDSDVPETALFVKYAHDMKFTVFPKKNREIFQE